MKKLNRDIKRAREKYEKALADLQGLLELAEVKKLGEKEILPNLRNVVYYGAYLHGVQMTCNKILHEWFKMDDAGKLAKKDDRLILEAVLEKVLESKLDAERWIVEDMPMMLEPVERDKKGTPTKYKASFYVEKKVRLKI